MTKRSTSKSPSQVFIDTSIFKALVDSEDQFHQKALTIWEKLEKEEVVLVTTNYVLDETFTLIRARCGVKAVDRFRQTLAASTQVLKVIRITVADEAKAWDWFLKNWSKLSFTDCVSFAVMKRLKITRVATFDRHFTRAGLSSS